MLLTPDVCVIWIHWIIHFLLLDLYLICFVLLISESYREGLLTVISLITAQDTTTLETVIFSTSAQNHNIPKKGFFFFWANSIYIKCSFSLSIFSLPIMKFKRSMENDCNYPSRKFYFIFKQNFHVLLSVCRLNDF